MAPVEGGCQDKDIVVAVEVVVAKVVTWPGDVTELPIPPGIDAKTMVPPEYDAHINEADCHGNNSKLPVEVTKPEPRVTFPELAFKTVHWKPLPILVGIGVSVIGWLQINRRPLWTVVSRFVLVVNSTTDALYVGNFPAIQTQIALKLWLDMTLPPCATQTASESPAGFAD